MARVIARVVARVMVRVTVCVRDWDTAQVRYLIISQVRSGVLS
jgi:hypothetical protein